MGHASSQLNQDISGQEAKHLQLWHCRRGLDIHTRLPPFTVVSAASFWESPNLLGLQKGGKEGAMGTRWRNLFLCPAFAAICVLV